MNVSGMPGWLSNSLPKGETVLGHKEKYLICNNALVYCLICTGTSSGGVSPTRREQPLFTLRQVGMICERLLKEREEKVREEYEETMTSKLAGWYTQSQYTLL